MIDEEKMLSPIGLPFRWVNDTRILSKTGGNFDKDYCWLGRAQILQIFRTSCPPIPEHRFMDGEWIREQLLEGLSRHLDTIAVSMKRGVPFVMNHVDKSESRRMAGLDYFYEHAPQVRDAGFQPGVMGLKGRALKLVGPAYESQYCIMNFTWLSELALGFTQDGHDWGDKFFMPLYWALDVTNPEAVAYPHCRTQVWDGEVKE